MGLGQVCNHSYFIFLTKFKLNRFFPSNLDFSSSHHHSRDLVWPETPGQLATRPYLETDHPSYSNPKSSKVQESTAPGVPRRSPIQVLIWPYVAWLRCSDGNRCFQHRMAVDISPSIAVIDSFPRPIIHQFSSSLRNTDLFILFYPVHLAIQILYQSIHATCHLYFSFQHAPPLLLLPSSTLLFNVIYYQDL